MNDPLQVRPRPLADVTRAVKKLTRPSPRLLTLYVLQLLLVFPAAPFAFLPLFFRYQTLRYRFDDDGVHASWGILFRREVSLTYARVQDIHLRRNLLERWLGIGRVQVQTASGGGGAELVIEGVAEFVEVRDFLYSKMRGATAHPTQPHGGNAEALVLLQEIKAELQQTRAALARASAPASAATTPAPATATTATTATTTTTTTKEPGHA